MNIAIIAANGRLGSVFVEEALRRGHSVTAGVYGKHNFVAQQGLEIIECNATKMSDLRKLVKDQSVVVSAIGHVKGSDANVQTTATANIISVMNEMKIDRYVDVTGTGVRFPGDKITMIDRVLNLAVRLIDPARVKDGQAHQELLIKSSLDWTTIRVLKLQNISAHPFTLRLHGPTKSVVGRREVALAMLEVIEEHSFSRQAPIVGKPNS